MRRFSSISSSSDSFARSGSMWARAVYHPNRRHPASAAPNDATLQSTPTQPVTATARGDPESESFVSPVYDGIP
jgi:hypothetical protein